MGNGYSPRIQPRSLWASVVHVFVATSLKADCSVARLRRCEPPPSQTVYRGGMFARRRPQLFCQQPSPRSLPSLSGWRGSRARGRKVSALKVVLPGRSRRQSFSAESLGPMLLAAAPDGARAVSSRAAALGRRRFAPPCRARSRATRLPLPRPREHCDSCTQHASPRSTRLDAEPSAGYDHQEQTWGALGPGLLGNVQVNGEGATEPPSIALHWQLAAAAGNILLARSGRYAPRLPLREV